MRPPTLLPTRPAAPLRRRIGNAINIAELRRMAAARVPRFAFEYVDCGAEDEATLAANRDVFRRWRLLPDALRPTEQRRLAVELLGGPSALPLAVAPTGYNGLQRRGADLMLARAARDVGVPFTLSTASSMSLEDVAAGAAGGRLWFQLYAMRDRGVSRALLERARAAGYEALVLTTDAVHYGNREWDRRSYRAPMKLTAGRPANLALHPGWCADVLRRGIPGFPNIAPHIPSGASDPMRVAAYFAEQMDARMDWSAIGWLREIWPGKLVVKGILAPADALRAAGQGADAVVLTNHGGRQLDHCVSPMETLEEIVQQVGDRLEILIDSGFRRGTDIAKALALGARAVLVGRATVYGVAAGGEAGARRALDILRDELDRTLAQLGCADVRALERRFLHPAPRATEYVP